MKNILAILTIFSLCVGTLQAQSRLGVSTGIGVIDARPQSVFVGDVADYVTHEVKYTAASPVFNAGVTYQNKIGWLFMQPSIQYSRYHLNYQIEAFPASIRGIYNTTEYYQYVDFHAVAGLSIENFRVGGGPVFHMLANYESDFGALPNVTIDQKKLTSGFVGQFGIDFAPLSLDIKYEGAFKTFGDHIQINEKRSKFTSGPSQYSISLAYTLPVKK